LDERGYRRGTAFMKFRRGVEQPPVRRSPLRTEQIREERAGDYGAVVAALFGLGSPLDRWFAALCTRARWACFAAFDESRLIGTAAAHFADTLGWLGAAGTLEDARRRGAQAALLAAKDPRGRRRRRAAARHRDRRSRGRNTATVVSQRPSRRLRGGVRPAVVASTRVGASWSLQSRSDPARRRLPLVCAPTSSAHPICSRTSQ